MTRRVLNYASRAMTRVKVCCISSVKEADLAVRLGASALGLVSEMPTPRVAPEVDALLLDSGNPSLAVKELGGTGRTHDWSLSAKIVEASPVPVFLAGGLGAGNVGEAIHAVRPFGVDRCTGVRTAGALDEQKLIRFMEAVAAATPDASPA